MALLLPNCEEDENEKRLISLLLTIVFCIGLLPVGALAVNDDGWDTAITYVDKFDSDGRLTSDTRTWGANYFSSNSDSSVTWNSISYVIPKDTHVTINGDLTAGGDTWLYLCDNATLTVTGSLNLSNNGFYIYGQTSTHNGDDAGKLIIKNSIDSGAAVRGGSNADQLHIYGGRLELYGGTDRSIINGVRLENEFHLLKGTLDNNSIEYSAWSDKSTLAGDTLFLDYCKHENTTYISIGDTQHKEICSDCGFEWPAETHNTNDVAYNEFDDTCHKLKCSTCGAVSGTAKAKHTLLTAPTDDGKGHTTRCNYCGYTSGAAVEPHDTDGEDGECSKCGFKQVAKDKEGNLYDSLQTAFETVTNGDTITLTADIKPSENITFGEYYDDETDKWVKPGYSVTLVMDGHTLYSTSGNPALEVAGGTLTVADDAVINQTGEIFEDSAAPAIAVTDGKVIFNGSLTAHGGTVGVPGNVVTQKPAVYADGGELDFHGDLDLQGGMKITGDAKLTHGLTQGTFYVDEGVKNTKRLSVEGSKNYESIRNLLADSHMFVDTDTKQYLIASYTYWTGNLNIVSHTHTWEKPATGDVYVCKECGEACAHEGGYKTGKCEVCGKPCPHAIADQSPVDHHYYCNDCGQQMFARIQTDQYEWAHYTNLKDAMAAAEDGQTITLLSDVNNDGQYAIVTGDNKTVTLDLKGHNITGGWIQVGIDRNWDAYTSSTLKIIGSGSVATSGNLSVGYSAKLDLSEWTGGENGRIAKVALQKNGKIASNPESILIVGENTGTLEP